ncbi:hypothetical protein [Ensifer sp. LCM 4579]|nr:hypothetical protein [Ensifer sp. LCM 4579]
MPFLFFAQAMPLAKLMYIPHVSDGVLGELFGIDAFNHLAPPKAKEDSL